MKNKKSFVAGLLASVLMLSGCDAFFDANNYADKNNFDANNQVYEIRPVEGIIEYEGTGKNVKVYFVPTVKYEDDESSDPVAIPKAEQVRIALDDENVLQIAHDGRIAFEDMDFRSNLPLTTAKLENFEEDDGKLLYRTLQSRFLKGIDAAPRYYYEQKEVVLTKEKKPNVTSNQEAAVALEVYKFDQEKYEIYSQKAGDIYKGITKNGLYKSVIFNYIKTGSGEQTFREPFEVEVLEETEAYISKGQVYLDPDTGAELKENGKLLVDVIVNINGNDISLRYNQQYDDTQNAITEMIESAKSEDQEVIDIVHSLITYRYFDIRNDEGEVVVTAPDINNFVIVLNEETEIGYDIQYKVSDKLSYLIELDQISVEHIVSVNSVIAEANAFYDGSNDAYLEVGEYAGIHLVGSQIVK